MEFCSSDQQLKYLVTVQNTKYNYFQRVYITFKLKFQIVNQATPSRKRRVLVSLKTKGWLRKIQKILVLAL